MKALKKAAAAILATVLVLSLSACSLPRPGFVEYDVSGYIQALLDSSYHCSSETLIETTGVSEEAAAENNATTVNNAAVRFCNTYGISPSEKQLRELQMVMKQAFALTRYTVKDERRVDGGYYLEVEVASITNFEGRQTEIQKLKEEAQNEAAAANAPKPTPTPAPVDEDDEDGDEDEDDGPESAPEPVSQPSRKIDVNELFVDKVLEFCIREVANISYDPDFRIVPLDIRQTDEGELQLDLNQIDIIDQTVIRF